MTENTFKVGQRVRAVVDRGVPGEGLYPFVGTEGNINTVLNLEDVEAYEVRFDGWPGLFEVEAVELEAVEAEQLQLNASDAPQPR